MNHSECVPECTQDTSHLMDNGHWETGQRPRCKECRQRMGHKMDCTVGHAFPYTPAPGDWTGLCCDHPLTLKGERNTSYYWECSEHCRCLISGCVPNYE